MNYIVFDLEWNQKTRDVAQVTTPLYLTGEIIEIGAVKLDENFKTVDEFVVHILPQYYTTMNSRITQLTKIHGNYLKKHGLPFPEAYELFRRWCGEDYGYMTWSKSDLPMLVDNMILHGIDISDLPVTYDIQRIFDYEIMRTNHQYSLDSALACLNEKGDTAHDALHDARNTVIVCSHLDLDACLDTYASRAFSEVPLEKEYCDMNEFLEDTSLLRFPCPCGGTVQFSGWVQTHSYSYIAEGQCEDGDEFILHLSRHKTGDGHFRVSRLMYEMNDDLWDYYMDKQEQNGLLSPCSAV